MRVQALPRERVHFALCSAVAWLNSDELISAGDDQRVHRVAPDGRPLTDLVESDSCVLCLAAPLSLPGSSRKAEALALVCSDGSLRLLSSSGKLIRSVHAHRGAALSCSWSPDGSAIASCGEDGSVKAFSSAGMLRGTLHSTSCPVYAVAWSPSGAHVALATGRRIAIANQQSGLSPLQWNAHSANVLALDWSYSTNLIVSGGEDCRYKVWDAQGSLLFHSRLLDQFVTSVAWRSDGECFAVGSFCDLLVCDRSGYVCARCVRTGIGSIFGIAWRPDGTRIACACGSGHIACYDVLASPAHWKNLEVEQEEPRRLQVHDLSNSTSNMLEFKERICSFSLAFDRLLVATLTQCFVYGGDSWNTPLAFDLQGIPRLLLQSHSNFLLSDSAASINVYSYEGKQLFRPRLDNLDVDLLNKLCASIAPDTLAIISTSDRKVIKLFDTSQGTSLSDNVYHSLEVTEVALSQRGQAVDRQLTFLDRNMDLYLTRALKPKALHKIATMACALRWHENAEMFAAVADRRLTVWYNPGAAFTDRDLLPSTREEQEGKSFGMVHEIKSFISSQVTLQRNDGATVVASISPYPVVLHECCQLYQWAKATRLCRFAKNNKLWAALAAFAVGATELDTAEVSYAALQEVDRVQYLQHVKRVPSKEGRSAEMALFLRKREEAEAILLQAGLVYRAITMHMDLFAWERALELAMKQKTHVDTVLYRRNKFLKAAGRQETSSMFQRYNEEVGFNEEEGRMKEDCEIDREVQRQ